MGTIFEEFESLAYVGHVLQSGAIVYSLVFWNGDLAGPILRDSWPTPGHVDALIQMGDLHRVGRNLKAGPLVGGADEDACWPADRASLFGPTPKDYSGVPRIATDLADLERRANNAKARHIYLYGQDFKWSARAANWEGGYSVVPDL